MAKAFQPVPSQSAAPPATQPKIPPRIVPSDDFEVELDGVVYYPHAGEHVEFDPFFPVSALRVADNVQRLGVRLEALKGADGAFSSDAERQVGELMVNHFDDLAAFIAPLIWGWNWTDRRGRPLPAPDGTPASLSMLSQEEIYYLWQAAQQRNTAARKNG